MVLNDFCRYRKGKANVGSLNSNNYVSTENMLPNREGITKATTLPTTQFTQEYKKGDVLVSNIRPYFKKIWMARFDGGCSNDVLVFQAKDDVNSNFLYYVLASDAFFSYSMATSKGTKMPRGDKQAIMQYCVPEFDAEIQKRIATILRTIDIRVENNKAINDNLAA